MKKLLAIILILATLATVFMSCNVDTQNNDEKASTPTNNPTNNPTNTPTNNPTITTITTVTREEWKNAFDFSKYGNFTYTVDEMLGEFDSVWLVKGTVISKNGTLDRNIKLTIDGEEETRFQLPEEKVFSLENNSMLLRLVMEEFNKSASLGYTMFDYKEDSKSYYTNIDMDGTPCDINIWFENKKIVKITLKGYEEFQEVDAIYSFLFD